MKTPDFALPLLLRIMQFANILASSLLIERAVSRPLASPSSAALLPSSSCFVYWTLPAPSQEQGH